LFCDNPLSIYAKALYTIVDGTVYFDREKDLELRKQIAEERNRLIRKMITEGKSSGTVSPAKPSTRIVLTCGDHAHNHALLEEDGDDVMNNNNQTEMK